MIGVTSKLLAHKPHAAAKAGLQHSGQPGQVCSRSVEVHCTVAYDSHTRARGLTCQSLTLSCSRPLLLSCKSLQAMLMRCHAAGASGTVQAAGSLRPFAVQAAGYFRPCTIHKQCCRGMQRQLGCPDLHKSPDWPQVHCLLAAWLVQKAARGGDKPAEEAQNGQLHHTSLARSSRSCYHLQGSTCARGLSLCGLSCSSASISPCLHPSHRQLGMHLTAQS